MTDGECEQLKDELIELSASAITFILTHCEDAFYQKAYDNWMKRIPRIKRILSQLYYHGVISSYTVRGMNIRWQWHDTFSQDVIKRHSERLQMGFERIKVEWEPAERNLTGEALTYKMDALSIACKIGAKPDVVELDAWTYQHYTKMLESGSDGQSGHYMYMKLEGAVFQMELVQPKPIRSRRVKRSETRTAQIAQSWQKLSAQ
jgi:hypothetical protein